MFPLKMFIHILKNIASEILSKREFSILARLSFNLQHTWLISCFRALESFASAECKNNYSLPHHD